jgi:hypothetical protein
MTISAAALKRLWPGGLAIPVAAAMIWAQFRGFDPLDAATHFLIYQHPVDNLDTHTHFALFARPFWKLCGGNIVAFRVLCLALISGAAVAFSRTWRPLVSGAADGPWPALALWLSAVAGVAWLPVVLGYNSLSTFFALAGLAALASLARPGIAARLAGGAAFLLAVAASALVKPPAALALLVLGCFMALYLARVPIRVRIILCLAAGIGAAVALFAVGRVVGDRSFDPMKLRYLGGVSLSPAWVISTLQRYVDELARFLPVLGRDLLWIIAPALGLLLCVAARPPERALPPFVLRALLALIVAAFTALVVLRGLWDGSFDRAISGEMARLYFALWAMLLPAGLAAVFVRRADVRDAAPFALGFFLLPLTSGFGSTNTLYFSALHWTVFWAAGLLVLSHALGKVVDAPQLHRLIALLLVITASAHLFSGHFLHPYMHQPALWRQDVPVAIGYPTTTLRLDAASARYYDDVRTILYHGGYRPGDDVFGFFNLPGLVFAVGARQPGAPWYFGTWYHQDDTDGGKLRLVPLERRRRAWIITQADVAPFRKWFEESGIDFPGGYAKIGETVNPSTGLEIGIWKPLSWR